jgi:hypothetical protein
MKIWGGMLQARGDKLLAAGEEGEEEMRMWEDTDLVGTCLGCWTSRTFNHDSQ